LALLATFPTTLPGWWDAVCQGSCKFPHIFQHVLLSQASVSLLLPLPLSMPSSLLRWALHQYLVVWCGGSVRAVDVSALQSIAHQCALHCLIIRSASASWSFALPPCLQAKNVGCLHSVVAPWRLWLTLRHPLLMLGVAVVVLARGVREISWPRRVMTVCAIIASLLLALGVMGYHVRAEIDQGMLSSSHARLALKLQRVACFVLRLRAVWY